MRYLLLLLLCSGCSTTNVTKFAQAMSKDTAHIHLEIYSPYGKVIFDREMPASCGTNVTKTETTVLRQ